MATNVSAQYDAFWFDKITNGLSEYNYGTCIAPNLVPNPSGGWDGNLGDLNATFPGLNTSYGNYSAQPNCYLAGFICCLYLDNSSGSEFLSTSVRLEMTFRYYTASGNIYNSVGTTFGFISAGIGQWGSSYTYWRDFRNRRIWNSSLGAYEQITAIHAEGNYFLPGIATQYSEGNGFTGPVLTVQSNFTISTLPYTVGGPAHIWVEGNNLCFSDDLGYKRIARSAFIATGTSLQPGFIWIDSNETIYAIPQPTDWDEYGIHYVGADGNIYRTTSQVRVTSLGSGNGARRGQMWIDNGDNSGNLGFVGPGAHVMFLGDWGVPPRNI